ncbi:MAG: M55 family metallopeptidase [Planctomycetota bacterium]
MKILMLTDLEGVAGVVSFETQTYSGGKYYEESRRLLTAEINAAVDGLLAAGADDVLVGDGHGPGAVYFPDLHERARLIHGRPGAPRSVRDEYVAGFDAFVMIGQHAMAGADRGNLNHTQNSRTTDYIKLNGKPIGEIAQAALYFGDLGLPLVFLTGDEAACREAEALVPGVVTAAVKQGLSRNSAISLSAPEARRRIREGAERALRAHGEKPLAPLVWEGPFVLERRFLQTDVADGCAGRPGVERVDSQTVRRRSDSIREVIYT